MLEKEFMGSKFLYAETPINLSSEWIKYSKNTFGHNKQFPIYTTFSHFTYTETGKNILVTDIQGKENILSDPAINSYDNKLLEDVTNLGGEGIVQFNLYQHKECNKICEKL